MLDTLVDNEMSKIQVFIGNVLTYKKYNLTKLTYEEYIYDSKTKVRHHRIQTYLHTRTRTHFIICYVIIYICQIMPMLVIKPWEICTLKYNAWIMVCERVIIYFL